MKLVIDNCKLVNALPSATIDKEGRVQVQKAEILYMGGKVHAENSKKLPNGDYSSLSVELEIVPQAKTWGARDGRSGSLIALEVRFGEVVESTPLKK